MIVGRAICRLLDGLTINVDGSDIVVKNNMGNQDALDKFIAESDKKGATKYPLIFYVTNTVKTDDEWSYCNTELIILMNTKEEMLYKERSDKTYLKYINPIYNKIKQVIDLRPDAINVFGIDKDKYPYDDIANFGITKNSVGDKKASASVVTDYVDARIIKINFRINTNCI